MRLYIEFRDFSQSYRIQSDFRPGPIGLCHMTDKRIQSTVIFVIIDSNCFQITNSCKQHTRGRHHHPTPHFTLLIYHHVGFHKMIIVDIEKQFPQSAF